MAERIVRDPEADNPGRGDVSMSLRVTVVSGHRVGELRTAWLALLPQDRWTFFVHPVWCAVTWESYFPRARTRLHLAYEGERLVGLLPTCHRRMNRFGLFLPVVDGFTGGRGDYTVPVTGPEPRPDVMRALFESAVGMSRRAGTLVLANLPLETGAPAVLEEVLVARRLSWQSVAAPSPILRLPRKEEDLEQTLKTALKSDIRRQTRRIEEALGPLDFRVVADRTEALALLPTLFSLHDRRWLDSGLPATFTDPAARLHFRRLVEELWPLLHLSVLSAGQRPVSFHLGMTSGNWLLYYKPVFDPEVAGFSPGKLHLRRLLSDAIVRGLVGVDFLQGAEGYKKDWTTETTDCRSFVVRTSATGVGYAWLTRGRPWLERVAGPTYQRVVTRLQRKGSG